MLSRCLRVGLSLIDHTIFQFFTELVSCWFFGNKLENGLSHDRNRWKKIGEYGKKWESTAGLLENAGFHVLQTRTYSLATVFPTYGVVGFEESFFHTRSGRFLQWRNTRIFCAHIPRHWMVISAIF